MVNVGGQLVWRRGHQVLADSHLSAAGAQLQPDVGGDRIVADQIGAAVNGCLGPGRQGVDGNKVSTVLTVGIGQDSS